MGGYPLRFDDPVDSRIIPISRPFFDVTAHPGVFLNFTGTLDGVGQATATVDLPEDTSFLGNRLHLTTVTKDALYHSGYEDVGVGVEVVVSAPPEPIVDFLFEESGLTVVNSGLLGSVAHGALSWWGAEHSPDTPSGSGQSLELDGTSGLAEIPDTWDYGRQLTVEAWIKPDAVSGEQAIWGDYGSPGVKLSVLDGQLKFSLSTSSYLGGGVTAVGGSIAAGVWTHVAAVYDGSQMRLFVDGFPVGTSPISGSILDNGTRQGYLGAGAFGIEHLFDGKIDDFRIFAIALDRTQLADGSFASIPAVSEWGMVVMTLLLIVAATLTLMRHRPTLA